MFWIVVFHCLLGTDVWCTSYVDTEMALNGIKKEMKNKMQKPIEWMNRKGEKVLNCHLIWAVSTLNDQFQSNYEPDSLILDFLFSSSKCFECEEMSAVPKQKEVSIEKW